MSRLALVDAYNVMFRLWTAVPEDRDDARRRLVREAESALRRQKGFARAHLILDTLPGAARAGQRDREGKVSWHYAHGSADDEILDHLRRRDGRSGGPAVVVVTDDRELAGRARQLGAGVFAVRRFFAGGVEPPRPEDRRAVPGGRPFRPGDFDLPEGPIDLLDADEELA